MFETAEVFKHCLVYEGEASDYAIVLRGCDACMDNLMDRSPPLCLMYIM